MIIVFNFTYNSNCSKESSEEEKMKKTYKKERRSFTKELSDFQKYSDDATLSDDKFSEIVLSTPINGSYKAMEEIIRIMTTPRGKPAGVLIIAFYQHPYTARALG